MLSYPGAGAAAPGGPPGRKGGRKRYFSLRLSAAGPSGLWCPLPSRSTRRESRRTAMEQVGHPPGIVWDGGPASTHRLSSPGQPQSCAPSGIKQTQMERRLGWPHRGPGNCFCLGGTRTAISVDADRPKCVLCVGRQSPESPVLTATQVCEHWTAILRQGPMPPVARRASLKPCESLALHHHGTSRHERHRPSGRHRHMSNKIIMSLQVPQSRTTG